MRRLLAAQVLMAIGAAHAADPPASDITCRDRHGLRVNTEECIKFLKEQQPLSDADCHNSPSCRADVERRIRAREEHWRQVDELAAARREREQAHAERQEAKKTSALKAQCGVDYKNPTIGMPIERVRQCVASSLTVAGQVNRADGVVTTYTTSSGAFFHVMKGRVVAWGR